MTGTGLRLSYFKHHVNGGTDDRSRSINLRDGKIAFAGDWKTSNEKGRVNG